MAESGCLKDGYFSNLQVENMTTADLEQHYLRKLPTDVISKQFDAGGCQGIHDATNSVTSSGRHISGNC